MAALTLAGCSREKHAPIDVTPAGFTRPASYPLGDVDAAREEHLAAQVTRILEPRFGKPRQSWYVREKPAQPDLVRADFARQLGDEWRPLQLHVAEPAATGFAFTNGEQAIAILMPAKSAKGAQMISMLSFDQSGQK